MNDMNKANGKVYILTIREAGFVIYESAHTSEKDARRMARAIVGESRTVVYTVDAR